MKVSVVTPSYNQGRFIERTLMSVATQEGVDIEHVVFDGGSTDETCTVLSNFEPAVRWVSRKDNGQTDAVNQGVRATDGPIIAWLNSDDIYYPGALARVVAAFEADPSIDVVYGMADHIGVDDVAFEQYPSESWNFDRLKETCFICQPAAFFRRSVVERFGLLDETLNYCMDYEFWLRLGKLGARFHYVEQKLAGSRMYADNKTLGARVRVHSEINDMFRRLFRRVPDCWLFNYAHTVVEQNSSRERHPRIFAMRLGVHSLLSALRWNGRISSSMIATTTAWVRAS